MMELEFVIKRHWGKLSLLFASIVVFSLSPIQGLREGFAQSANESRLIVEEEFKKAPKERNNVQLKGYLSALAELSPALFELVLIKNSFYYDELESLKLDETFYQGIQSKALKDILDVELAIKSKDIQSLESIHERVQDENMRDYIVYAAKSIDSKSKLDFRPDSPLKALYIK